MRTWGNLGQDWRFGWRSFRRNPGFAATALLTLALGVAAATAMFSIVEAVWLRPLPYHDPGRLVAVSSDLQRAGVSESTSAYGNIADWRRMSHTLEDLAAYDGQTVTVTGASGEAERVSAVLCDPDLFAVLGVAPEQGRAFTVTETEHHDVLAVISHGSWLRRFGGDAAVLGRRLVIDGQPTKIIGVMPAGFDFPDRGSELWLPLSFKHDWETARHLRGMDSWRVVARLAPGASLGSAQTELSGIAATLDKSYPADNAGIGAHLVPLSLQLTGRPLRLALLLLAGAVFALLLVACSNVGNLLLVRGALRQREFAVREALGASRARVVRQLLAEAVILAALAAGLGAGLADLGLRAIRVFGPGGIPRLSEAALDGRAFGFAAVLSLASVVIFGLLPALANTRRLPMDMLRGAGRGLSAGAAARRLRTTLIVAELALAVALLVASTAFLRSFARLTEVDPGFRTDQVLVIDIVLPPGRPDRDSVPYSQAVLERVRALPGVAAAAFVEEMLLGNMATRPRNLAVEGAAGLPASVVRLPVSLDAITPDFFRATGVTLRAGRLFSDQDGPESPPVVIINETLARQLWPGENPIGRRLRNAEPDSVAPWATVVGVVADLRRQGPDIAPIGQTFWPLTQHPSRGLVLLVATRVEPSTLAASVRAAALAVDRSVPVRAATTLRQTLDSRLAGRRFNLGLLGAFALGALALAGVGIFGLMSYTVTQRRQEIGIRMALGATPQAVVGLIVGEGLRLALAGIAIGALVAAVVLRGLASLLYGTSAMDPVSFGAGAAVLLAVTLVACYLPARRALSLDPLTALQAE